MTGQSELRSTVELSAAALPRLDPRVAIPRYDRASLARSIVHIGVGGFHRAHQAVYLDDLCGQGQTGWSIVGAGCPARRRCHGRGPAATGPSLHADHPGRARHERARHRFAGGLRARDAQPRPARRPPGVPGDTHRVPDHHGGWLPRGRGQRHLPAAGAGCHPAGLRGAGSWSPCSARCGPGCLHGPVLRQHHGQRATPRARPPSASAPWSSPASRTWVARTPPSPTAWSTASRRRPAESDRESLAREYHLHDRWPVVAETFIQWVIEDAFAYGRPAYEDAGVLLTHDVRPYETLKLRILNAGHSTSTYMAALVGHVYIHEIMADPLLARSCSASTMTRRRRPCRPSPASMSRTTSAWSGSASPIPRSGTKWPGSAWTAPPSSPSSSSPPSSRSSTRAGQVKLSALALAGWCQYLLAKDDAGPGHRALRRSRGWTGALVCRGLAL